MMCDSGPCHTVLMMRFHTVHSLANNSICCEGNMEGLNALIEALKQMPQLVSLKCVSSRTPTARFAMMCDSGLCHTSETAQRAFASICLQLGLERPHQQWQRHVGRDRSRSHPQGLPDCQSEVSLSPTFVACVTAGAVIQLKPLIICVLGSLDGNLLCGVNYGGRGTFTTEGIVVLCEGLKQSKVSSLR